MRDFRDRDNQLAWNRGPRTADGGLAPGKRTLVEMLPQPVIGPATPTATSEPVQRKMDAEAAPVDHAHASSDSESSAASAQLQQKTESSEPAPAPSRRRGPSIHELFGRVQHKLAGAAADTAEIHASAQRGIGTTPSPLPYVERIQPLFGRHDISGIKAHTGSDAAASAGAMGAKAYATGDHVVLGGGADLHTVAHEAAHVIQQCGGVQLKGGVGAAGDQYEQHADQVADAVVAGRSAGGAARSVRGRIERQSYCCAAAGGDVWTVSHRGHGDLGTCPGSRTRSDISLRA